MFCPNCGTQNPDAAQTCSKCNFHLKSVAAPKFKGTMLMMNQPGPMPGPAPAAPAPAMPPGAAPAARPAGPAAGGHAVPSKLKGTMVGVAPMAGPSRGGPGPVAVPPAGSGAPGAPGFPQAPAASPAPPPADAVSAYSPPVPQPGVNPLGGTLAADASAFAAGFGGGANPGQPPYGQPGTPGHAAGHALGGTALMPAAGGPGFGGYTPPAGAQATQLQYGVQGQAPYGAPQGGYGAQPPQGGLPYGGQGPTHGAPPGPGYGGPPPGAPPYGAAPQAAYGAGAAAGYGGAPPYDAPGGAPSYTSPSSVPPPNPFTAPSTLGSSGPSPSGGYGTPGPAQGLAPYNAASSALAGGVSGALAAGSAGPTRRNPIMTLLLPFAVIFGGVILGTVLAIVVHPLLGLLNLVAVLAGSIWNLLQVIAMTNEVKSVTRNDAFAWWPIFVPFYNLYWMLLLFPQEVGKAKQSLGIQTPVRNIVLYFFLWPFAAASDINDMAR